MSILRVIDTDLADPAYTVALDSAMLLARGVGEVPDTLHLYRRSRPTISVGYFQDVSSTVDVKIASEMGISIIRRASGGSSIYTDPGQVIFSVILPTNEVPENPLGSYQLFCRCVVQALQALGIGAEWKSLNDIVVKGRKISGSAQARKHGAVLHHGTLLVDTDLDLMMRVLRPREGRPVRSADEMTTVVQELGRDVPVDAVKQALVEGFASGLGKRPIRGCLTPFEKEEVKRSIRGAYCIP